jgi:hypothetical protein
MTQRTPRAAALVLSALMTLAVVAGMNRIAATQYAKADRIVMASIAGHRANA